MLPAAVRDALQAPAARDQLLEVVLDLGRVPEARYPGRAVALGEAVVDRSDLEAVVQRLGAFGGDNRAGIERTLHRISAIRNRTGAVVGLTCRVGRAVFGTVAMVRDLMDSGQSLLLMGRPGVGKTTALREIARVLADELGKRVFEEMDYCNEASNAEAFARLHAHNPRIAVPCIHRHATARRVLTMEWIDGVKLTNLEAVRELGIDPDDMVTVGVNCSLQQLLEHGFFHADPHPGNLLALPDGRLAYLDFGMMSEVSRESRTGLIQAVVHLVNRNFGKLSKDFVSLGFLAEDVNLEPIVPAFETVFGQALEMGVSRMDFKAVTDDLSGVMYRFPFRVPPYYALIIRSLVTLEGIALSVDPDFKILGAAYPYFARRLMEDPDPQLRDSLREMLFDGEIFRWQRLDNLISSAAAGSQLDLEGLLDQVLDFLFSPKAGLLRNQLVEAAVEFLYLIMYQL